MSIETDTAADIDGDDVEALATEFGEAIAELPVYQRFMETKDAVENHEEAQAAIKEFEQIREEFMLARQTGNASQEDLRKVQQKQVNSTTSR